MNIDELVKELVKLGFPSKGFTTKNSILVAFERGVPPQRILQIAQAVGGDPLKLSRALEPLATQAEAGGAGPRIATRESTLGLPEGTLGFSGAPATPAGDETTPDVKELIARANEVAESLGFIPLGGGRYRDPESNQVFTFEQLLSDEPLPGFGGAGGGGGARVFAPQAISTDVDPVTGEILWIDPNTRSVTRSGEFVGIAPKQIVDPRTGNLLVVTPDGKVTDTGQKVGFADLDPQEVENRRRQVEDRKYGFDVAGAEEAGVLDRATLAENARRANLQAATSAFGDVVRTAPQLGQLALQNAEFTRDVTRNAPDYLARAFFQEGQKSPLPQVSQADLINQLTRNISGFNETLQGFNPQVGGFQAPPAFKAQAAPSAAGEANLAALKLMAEAANDPRAQANERLRSARGPQGEQVPSWVTGFAGGGYTTEPKFKVGDSRTGQPTGHEEIIGNPTNAPISVTPMNGPMEDPKMQMEQKKADAIGKVLPLVDSTDIQHMLVDEMAQHRKAMMPKGEVTGFADGTEKPRPVGPMGPVNPDGTPREITSFNRAEQALNRGIGFLDKEIIPRAERLANEPAVQMGTMFGGVGGLSDDAANAARIRIGKMDELQDAMEDYQRLRRAKAAADDPNISDAEFDRIAGGMSPSAIVEELGYARTYLEQLKRELGNAVSPSVDRIKAGPADFAETLKQALSDIPGYADGTEKPRPVGPMGPVNPDGTPREITSFNRAEQALNRGIGFLDKEIIPRAERFANEPAVQMGTMLGGVKPTPRMMRDAIDEAEYFQRVYDYGMKNLPEIQRISVHSDLFPKLQAALKRVKDMYDAGGEAMPKFANGTAELPGYANGTGFDPSFLPSYANGTLGSATDPRNPYLNPNRALGTAQIISGTGEILDWEWPTPEQRSGQSPSAGFGFNVPQLPTPAPVSQEELQALERRVRPPAISKVLGGGLASSPKFGFELFTPQQIRSLTPENRQALGTTLGTQFNETLENVGFAQEQRFGPKRDRGRAGVVAGFA